MIKKDFKEIWEEKRAILSASPEKCAVTVSADSRLVEGFMSRVKARSFDIVVDQNKGMGGTDQGPRPSEYVLAAWPRAMRSRIVCMRMRSVFRWKISL